MRHKFYDSPEYKEKQRQRTLANREIYKDPLIRKKISDAQNRRWADPAERQRQSTLMQRVVKENPDSYSTKNVSGRVKMIEYNGKTFKGNWEVLFAKYLEENAIVFEQPNKPIPYYWNESWHLYFVDFFLPTYNIYVEIKGFERERDLAKWKAVPNLIVLKLKEINEIKRGTFNLNILTSSSK